MNKIIALALIFLSVVIFSFYWPRLNPNDNHEQTLFETTACDNQAISFTYLSKTDNDLTLLFGINTNSFKNPDFITSKTFIFKIKQIMPNQTIIIKSVEINKLTGSTSLHDNKTNYSPWLTISPLANISLPKGLNKFEITSSCNTDNLQNIRAYYALNYFNPKI